MSDTEAGPRPGAEAAGIATIGILGMGHMGAGIAAELSGAGLRVTSCLAGRSPRGQARAAEAGVAVLPDFPAFIAGCDVFLSVTPADQAEPLADAVATALMPGRPAPLHFVDCNSITPSRTRRVAARIRGAGAVFSDGGIIGAPPGEGRAPARLYVSGPEAHRLTALATPQLLVKPLGPGETRATEMKILFAAANKGAVALLANVLAGAERAGLTDAVIAELETIRPGLLAGLLGHAGELPDKAGRWAIEMRDVAEGLADLGVQRGYHDAAADGYAALDAALAAAGEAGMAEAPLARVLRAWQR
ncbi:MAG: NAD(P)-binding domain-containing protein [Pseudomonadota bacterium]